MATFQRKTWALFLTVAIVAGSALYGQTEIPGGDLPETTTWTLAGSPYLVRETIKVLDGVTLTVEPGVEVRFSEGAGMNLMGVLMAEGTESSLITFTADVENPAPAAWGELKFMGTGSVLRWCLVEYAARGVTVGGGDMTITDSTIRQSDRGIVVSGWAHGCYGERSTASILRCLVEDNTYFGVGFGGNGDESTGCTVPRTGSAGGELRASTVRRNGSKSYWNDGVYVSANHGYFTNGSANPVIESNSIYENGGAGVALVGDGDNEPTVRNNFIHHNSESGLRSSGLWGYKQVLGNSIYDNAESGIENTDERMIIRGNRITDNAVHGLDTTHVHSFTDNEVHGNGQYDFHYKGSEDQLTAFNDWGSSDAGTIESKIYDQQDDPSLGRVIYDWGKQLYFAQFGDGRDEFTSEILLFNMDERGEARVDIWLRGDQGEPLTVDLDGQVVQGGLHTTIPPGALRSLRTDGKGELSVGSVTVTSDRSLAGVIEFGGVYGLAGVGSSDPIAEGFLAPMEVQEAKKTDTGVAIMNLEEQPLVVDFDLCDLDGHVLASSQEEIPGLGHLAQFVGQFDWNEEIDFADFGGLLKARAPGRMAATVIQTRSSEFATMPVSPLPGASAQSAGTRGHSVALAAASTKLAHKLRFAQFGEGQGQIFSQLMLCNLNNGEIANVQIDLRNDDGNELTVDLNGVEVSGLHEMEIPPSGLRILKTDGEGPLVAGSVTVSSDRLATGAVLFGGSFGVAGVGSSELLYNGFVAPVETDLETGVNSGIAVMNPHSYYLVSSLRLELLDPDGNLLATAELRMPPQGHEALYIDQIEWDTAVDLSKFEGLLRFRSSVAVAATVIRTSPGQFATMPAVAIP